MRLTGRNGLHVKNTSICPFSTYRSIVSCGCQGESSLVSPPVRQAINPYVRQSSTRQFACHSIHLSMFCPSFSVLSICPSMRLSNRLSIDQLIYHCRQSVRRATEQLLPPPPPPPPRRVRGGGGCLEHFWWLHDLEAFQPTS